MDTGYELAKKSPTVKRKKTKLVKSIIPWLFVLPGIIFTAWLRYIPIISSIIISFFDYDVVNPLGKFIGLGNYKSVLSEASFLNAWKNTFIFMVLIIALTFFIPIIQALFLNEIIRFRKTFTTIYIIPSIIPVSINVILWKWIWNPDNGIANVITNKLGLGSFLWLSDPRLTKFAIIFPGVIGGGISVLIYLAAIQQISRDLNEAAYIDGCSGWKRLFHITLPNIKFIIMINFILAVISSMQILDAPFQYTSGGPNGVSTSIGLYIYKAANEDLMYGKSSAAAMILFIVIVILTVLQMKLDKSETN
jgi:multiple sugar transport system permease protein